MHSIGQILFRALLCAVAIPWVSCATAYYSNGRWSYTATNGFTASVGNPVTLTWSIVPDGTTISHLGRPSNLVATLDSWYGSGTGGADLTQRPWFSRVKQSFDRWTELSGLKFVYEPADDGLLGRPQGQWAGQLGQRGDVRLAGAYIDGFSGTLAETGFIPNADITIDTADSSYYPPTNSNFVNLRNTLTHEIGHSFGLGHIDSNNAAFLMESNSSSAYDGPQLDDIRGIQYLYGDAYERLGSPTGNNTIATATPLGALTPGDSLLIGEHAATGTAVLASESDFVSIANASDLDFFSFTTTAPSTLDLMLTPIGPSYAQRINSGAYTTVNSSAISDLALQLYSTAGELLAAANAFGLGQAESLLDIDLPTIGTYYARISGTANDVQLYQLQLSSTALIIEPPALVGDFNDDGIVNAADYVVWRDNLGSDTEQAIEFHGDGANGVDTADYELWRAHFGESLTTGIAAAQSLPEPGAIAIVGIVMLAGMQTSGRVRCRPRRGPLVPRVY